jgi:peptidoglycan hydrolase-like protein with peptidoglycan-binding domain
MKKKLAVALLATAALSMPAMAASNMTQQPQDRQAQQSQDQQTQAQYPNNQEGQPSNTNQAAQNQPNNEQTISPKSLSRNEVRQVQQALDKNGVQAGKADGRWGPKTSDALKQFQQSKNIQANGQLDQQTLSDLGLNGAQFAQQNQNNSSQTR